MIRCDVPCISLLFARLFVSAESLPPSLPLFSAMSDTLQLTLLSTVSLLVSASCPPGQWLCTTGDNNNNNNNGTGLNLSVLDVPLTFQ